MKNICQACGIEFESVKPAKTCSPKCRVALGRKASVVTDNVTLDDPDVTLSFEFYTETAERDTEAGKVPSEKSGKRTAKYWYDVPLGAIPIIQKDWPKNPGINGRQYFLWWKNEFQVDSKGDPIILNPFPQHENVQYFQAGDNSRRWGA